MALGARTDIDRALPADVSQLAGLLWLHASPEEQAQQAVEAFAVDLAAWWEEHAGSHIAFVAREAGEAVGMAWLALVPRVPRPGTTARRSGDVQSVFVLPECRGRGIGTALVRAVTEHALTSAARVTVQSGERAVPVYERLGFASSRQLLQLPAD